MARPPANGSHGRTSTPSAGAEAGKARRWARRKDARPNELVAAAFDLFVERGFAATRLEDVAARAGVTKGTLYLYFDSKEALFEAVVREAVMPNLARIEHLVAAHQGSAADLLRALIGFWWDNVGSTPLGRLPKLIFSEAGNFPAQSKIFHDEIISRAQRVIAGIIRRGVEAGEFRPCDPSYVARLVIAPLVFLTIWNHSMRSHEDKPLEDRRFLETHVDLLLNGLVVR